MTAKVMVMQGETRVLLLVPDQNSGCNGLHKPEHEEGRKKKRRLASCSGHGLLAANVVDAGEVLPSIFAGWDATSHSCRRAM